MSSTVCRRATLQAFPDAGAATAAAAEDIAATPWRILLDGDWRFLLVERPEDAPADWTAPQADLSGWRSIRVPGVWTRQDTGDAPHYANWLMPFDCPHAPQVPERNPTGLYRTTFDAPPQWAARGTVLHIGGFESVALVWCSGEFVGMGKVRACRASSTCRLMQRKARPSSRSWSCAGQMLHGSRTRITGTMAGCTAPYTYNPARRFM